MRAIGLAVVLVAAIGCSKSSTAAKTPGPVSALIDCPTGGSGGDNVTRGFYIDSFPGVSLAQLTLTFEASSLGDYPVTLVAHAGTYNGPVIGKDSIVATVNADSAPATFDFGNKLVTPGSVVAFVMAQHGGPGTLFFETNTSNTTCLVVETESTVPPLDTLRNIGMVIHLTGAAGYAP